VSHFAQYIKSLAIFSEEKQQEIHWLFDSLINSLAIAERNAQAQRHASAGTSLRHAKNLMRFLDRSFQDLPDSQLVSHLKEFFRHARALDGPKYAATSGGRSSRN
jgi:flagellin-specific chaperone FliS